MILNGEIKLPGDKSISHRAVMLGAVSIGTTRIFNFLNSEDCLSTTEIMRKLGADIEFKKNWVEINGKGFEGLSSPQTDLYCANSGTTARLLMGLLSGAGISCTLTGDESLSKRPMRRVSEPLKAFNAQIKLTADNFLPAAIIPSKIKKAKVIMEVASAQVKSALILAALKSKESSVITELTPSRNHTELMLKYLGADIETEEGSIRVSGKNELKARDIVVPGDISSAAFFIVAALITPSSSVTVKDCGLNPTRTGILTVLDLIGADYDISNKKLYGFEPAGDLIIRYKEGLKPFVIDQELIPLLIDEIPVLALLATQINGVSEIRDCGELRVKESDRLNATATELSRLGARVRISGDDLIIEGKTPLKAAEAESYNDHRLSMMLKVARLICPGLIIHHADCDAVSYPSFENDLHKLLK